MGKCLFPEIIGKKPKEEHPKITAQELGFGILFENGDDLIVIHRRADWFLVSADAAYLTGVYIFFFDYDILLYQNGY